MYTTSKPEILDNMFPSSCQILSATYPIIDLEVTTTKGNFPRKAGISFTHFRENLKITEQVKAVQANVVRNV